MSQIAKGLSDPLFKRALAQIAKGGGLFYLHALLSELKKHAYCSQARSIQYNAGWHPIGVGRTANDVDVPEDAAERLRAMAAEYEERALRLNVSRQRHYGSNRSLVVS